MTEAAARDAGWQGDGPAHHAGPSPVGFTAADIRAAHDAFLAGTPLAPAEVDAWRWIDENHRCNTALWREEDKARRTEVPDAEIVRCKRAIDRLNQQRNDAVEALDQCVLERLAHAVTPLPDARLSSETVGAIVDRLSILALKIFHMRLQTRRDDADEPHLLQCRHKLDVLVGQRRDLAACLDRLLEDLAAGRAVFRTYRQYKMYNDPTLNPELYGRRPAAATTASAPDEGIAVDVLIPTCNRPAALAVTLTAVLAQSHPRLRIVVSDQGDCEAVVQSGELRAVLRLFHARGIEVDIHRHLPRRGMAEQRQFLLDQARASYALFLDDDVLIEADLTARLLRAIREQRCGFVGSAVIGLSHAGDERPDQQTIEFWDGPVEPEKLSPGDTHWGRHHLHSAANLYHLQQRLGLNATEQRLYRVAWVGGCVMFDVAKLRDAGGFGFWRRLPPEHCGEDVQAQLAVMARYGGCGLLPSGAYHQELPTTLATRDIDAPFVLPDRMR